MRHVLVLANLVQRFAVCAKGDQDLARLVREQQDLLSDRDKAYRNLDAAVGKADIKAGEAARAAIAEIEATLAKRQGQLRRSTPLREVPYSSLLNEVEQGKVRRR